MSLIEYVRAEMAREPLRFVPDQPKLSWREILHAVARKHNIPVDWILSERRSGPIVLARQEAMYRIYEETTLSLPGIGSRLNRDHTTVLHGIRAHAKRIGEGQGAE